MSSCQRSVNEARLAGPDTQSRCMHFSRRGAPAPSPLPASPAGLAPGRPLREALLAQQPSSQPLRSCRTVPVEKARGTCLVCLACEYDVLQVRAPGCLGRLGPTGDHDKHLWLERRPFRSVMTGGVLACPAATPEWTRRSRSDTRAAGSLQSCGRPRCV